MEISKQYWRSGALAVASWIACGLPLLRAGESRASDASMLAASPKGGVFSTNIVVRLNTKAKEIRYTLDGSEPATNSPLYTAPIVLTNSALLQARAFFPDLKTSYELVESYTVLETNALDFTSSLPLVVISTFGRSIVPHTNIAASIRFINAGTNQRATLLGGSDYDGVASIHARGYTSLRYPKRSYGIETRDAFGRSEAASILGFPKDTDWVLYAPYPDKTLMRDVLAYELSNKLGRYASRTRFVELFLNDSTNKLSRTHYAGVYVLEEKIKRGENRVAIQKLSSHEQTEPNISGGYIFKKDHLEEAVIDGTPEPPGKMHLAGLRNIRPIGPGGFPADPAGFTAPEAAFSNAVSVVTNVVSMTNTIGGTNLVMPALGATVIASTTVVVTNTLSVTNSVINTNAAMLTNMVVSTNAIVASKVVVSTNPVVASNAIVGTNAVATTNAVDANTTVITTTLAIMTTTTYRTNLVVATNTLTSTNLMVATNTVVRTNVVVSTNVTVAAVPVTATNSVLVTNLFILSSHRPGLLEKLVATGKGFVTGHTNAFFYVEPKATQISSAQRTWLVDYINRFEKALYGPDFRNPTNGYAAFIDVDSFIDHHLFVEATKNIDGFRFSTFYTKDRGGKIKMGPIWDWNLSFGNARGKHGYTPEDWYWPQLDDEQYSWFRRLFEDPDFGQRYVDRWAQWQTNIFAASNVLSRVDELAAFLKEPAARNFERWPILGQVVEPERFAGKTYEDEIQYLKSWVTNRLSWMTAQFVAPPAASHRGGTASSTNTLSFSGGGGQVYFTVDGSDPRGSGGAVSPLARPYQAPIAVTNSVTVVARAQKENRWSNPVTVRFVGAPKPPGAGG